MLNTLMYIALIYQSMKKIQRKISTELDLRYVGKQKSIHFFFEFLTFESKNVHEIISL